MPKFKWTIEIEVDETWVADGFNLENDEDGFSERAKEMVLSDLTFAYGHEVSAKVLKSPARAKILKVQGYRDEAHYQELEGNIKQVS